ncbi:hypothetical protein ACPF8X_26960 [Streptomyces sp. G35A]
MTDLIGRLVAWADALFTPRGAHRRTGPRPVPPSAPPSSRPTVTRLPLPAHRSPYGLHPLLDGAETVAVRPYVAVSWFHEGRAA